MRIEICSLHKTMIDRDCLRNRFEMRDQQVFFLFHLLGLAHEVIGE